MKRNRKDYARDSASVFVVLNEDALPPEWGLPSWAGEQITLSASGLRLTDVPEHARESVRAFLAPLLQSIPIRTGECSIASKLLIRTANSPRVEYVEGVWSNERMSAVPHAWNTVDRHVVDLTVEYKFALMDNLAVWPDELPHWQRTPSQIYVLQQVGSAQQLCAVATPTRS